MKHWSESKGARLFRRFMRECAKPDGGLSVFGHEEIASANESGGLQSILICEGVDLNAGRLDCDIYAIPASTHEHDIVKGSFGGAVALKAEVSQ